MFPHFIASQLPQGARGLLIAAVFAAAMSTVSTSLNSSATLVMSDFYKRLYRSESTDQQQVRVCDCPRSPGEQWARMMALALVRLTESALDVWWLLSGVLGAAIIGLFLLGIMVPEIRSRGARWVLAVGMALIAWMAMSRTDYWPESLAGITSPFHPWLVVVLGPSAMVLVGWLATRGHRPANS